MSEGLNKILPPARSWLTFLSRAGGDELSIGSYLIGDVYGLQWAEAKKAGPSSEGPAVNHPVWNKVQKVNIGPNSCRQSCACVRSTPMKSLPGLEAVCVA